MRRFNLIVLGVLTPVIAGLIIGRFFGDIGAPKLASLKLIRADHHHGCWAIITDDSCYTTYTYAGKGSMRSIISAVYSDFSKNPNYKISESVEDSIDSGSIIVSYRDAKSQSGSDWGFGVDFTIPPASTNDAYGFFIPTKDCPVGATDCVEARMVR